MRGRETIPEETASAKGEAVPGETASVKGEGAVHGETVSAKGEAVPGRRGVLLPALRTAFPYTIPIFASFWFLGLAYGIYMHMSGFSFLWPMGMSMVIFGGSLEFVAAEMLLSPFAPMQVFLMAVLIQARHLFYGLAMLDEYRDLGRKRWYLIFGLCDETFAICHTMEIPEGVDRGWTYTFVTLLDQFYWVSGATLGGLLGPLLRFDTEGLGFVMTAMFVAIFLDQWRKEPQHVTGIAGLGAGAACLAVFGPDRFLIPAMAAVTGILLLLRPRLEGAYHLTEDDRTGGPDGDDGDGEGSGR